MDTVGHGRSPTPEDRASPAPPASRRASRVLFIALAAVVGVLSFADRAPDLVGRSLGASVRFSMAVEDSTGVRIVDARDLPYSWDLVGHFVLWSAVAVVGWFTFRHRISALRLAVWLFVASYAIEIGQIFLTATRRPDPRDLLANAIGIAVGVVAAVAIDRTASAVRRRPRAA